MPALGLGLGLQFNTMRGGSVGPVDPLAGIASKVRWYGTKDIATCGMYLDVNCTTPITAEWDPVAGLKDEVNDVIVATQSDINKRPVAILASDGTWCFECDGSDDDFGTGISVSGVSNYTSVLRSTTFDWNSYWGVLDTGDGIETTRSGMFEGGTKQWHFNPFPLNVKKNTVALTSPFIMGPSIEDWMAMTVESFSAIFPAERRIGSTQNSFFGAWQCCFIFWHEDDNTSDQINTVDNYANSIIPT